MRIFIGLAEIANIAATYAKGFRALGHETYTMILSRNPFYPDAQYDIVVDDYVGAGNPNAKLTKKIVRQLKQTEFRVRKFWPILRKCDLFVFIYGFSFLPGYWDYPLLKSRGKRIISVFLGSDTRYGPAFEQEMRLLGLDQEVKPFIDYIKELPGVYFFDKLKTIQMAERYADLILSQPGNGQLQTRPYMRMNVPLDLAQLRFNVPGREIPLILHAPSNRNIKGTDYVLAAIEQLKQEGIPFEFRLIEKMPNAQLRSLLAEADIVVDELFADTVGVLSLEAMATGNVVLVHYPAEYAAVPSDCPAVNVTKDDLADKLRQVILDRELRRRLVCAGRPYVETYHDHRRVAQQILDWLEPGRIQKYDFVPTFYQNFVMPPELLKEERQKTQLLRRLQLRYRESINARNTHHSI